MISKLHEHCAQEEMAQLLLLILHGFSVVWILSFMDSRLYGPSVAPIAIVLGDGCMSLSIW